MQHVENMLGVCTCRNMGTLLFTVTLREHQTVWLQWVVWIWKKWEHMMHLLSGFAVKMRHDYQHPNVWKTDMVVSILMQQMTTQCPSHQNSCWSLSRHHPVAISHGCSSLDYHGDNPEVKGSVPGPDPPHCRLPLRRRLFTSCHFKVVKWTKHKTKSNKKSAIISTVTSWYSAAIIGWNWIVGICWRRKYW